MQKPEQKITELEKQVKWLMEQVNQMKSHLQYLDREHVRAKSEIDRLQNTVARK
jgi:ribosomal protein S15P/S13E